jgi:hypothetical protein
VVGVDGAANPLGIPMGRLLPVHTPTEPIPALDGPPTPRDGASGSLMAVKATEICGPCGSTLSVEWIGRTDTLRVIREWRTGHRCAAPPLDGTGHKADRVGFMPE